MQYPLSSPGKGRRSQPRPSRSRYGCSIGVPPRTSARDSRSISQSNLVVDLLATDVDGHLSARFRPARKASKAQRMETAESFSSPGSPLLSLVHPEYLSVIHLHEPAASLAPPMPECKAGDAGEYQGKDYDDHGGHHQETGWSDSCRVGFAPAPIRGRVLHRGRRAPPL